MKTILHITIGDYVGESLNKSGMSGDLLVWHDIDLRWPPTTRLAKR